MKKVLLILLVSSLLVSSIAGTALANPAQVDIKSDPIAYGTPSVVTIYNMLSETNHRMIKLGVAESGLSVRVYGKNGATIVFDSNWVNPAVSTTGEATTIAINDYNPALLPHVTFSGYNGITYYVEVAGKTKDNQVYLKDSYSDSVTDLRRDTASASPSSSIPEFPTVALPVAAILGLIFVFGHKKGDL